MSAVRHIRMNNTSAFKGTALEIMNFEVRTPRGSVHTVRGCRCRRSKCQKKYCECFSAGLDCTNNCVCVDCANGNTLSSPTNGRTAQEAGDSNYKDGPEIADQKLSRVAPVTGKGKVNSAVQGASAPSVPAPATRRQKDSTSAGPDASWGQDFQGSGNQYTAPGGAGTKSGVAGTAVGGSSYFHPPNGHSGQPGTSNQGLQSANVRPPTGPVSGVGTRSAATAAALSSSGSSRRKPSISVQVPVAAFSKGSVIPLSDPASGASGGPVGSSGADSALEGDEMVRFDESRLLPTPQTGDQLQTPKSEFAGLLGSAGQPKTSETFSFSWKGQSPYYSSGMTPAAPPSASGGAQGFESSPREGLRSRRLAASAGGGGGAGRFPVPTFPSASGGGASNSGTGGFGFGGGGDGGSASAGLFSAGLGGSGLTPFGTGLTPFGGGDSPAPYTRSRSANLANAVLHRNTPPTSPSTWSAEPLGDLYQDPDGVLPAPLSSRAWMHRDMH